jgi:hypothetical protein
LSALRVVRDVAREHQEIADAAMERNASIAGRLIGEHLQRTASLLVDSPNLTTEKAFVPNRPRPDRAAEEETDPIVRRDIA